MSAPTPAQRRKAVEKFNARYAVGDPGAIPMTSNPASVGRFGHHPDHIIDYSVEVECIQSMCADYGLTGQAFGDDDKPVSLDDLMRRLWRANGFRVGVVPEALQARRALVECTRTMERVYVS